MIKTLSLILSLLLVVSCQSSHELLKVKVLTFNILGGRNVDNKHDLNRIAEVINRLNPDIVALQEVDKGTRRIKGRDITKEIAKLTGMHHAFGKAMNYDGGEYGEAILSKQPILKVINHPLPAKPNAEPRAALEVIINVPNSNLAFSFIATHLDHLDSDVNRLMQAEAINEILSTKNHPFIIAGDLNATPDSKTIKILDIFTNFNEVNSLTYPTKNPKIKIDWIGTDKSAKWHLNKVYTATEFSQDADWLELLQVTSDHLPLMKEYSFID